MSFYGGTDVTPTLSEAIKMLNTENYKKADVIMISDFIMPSLSNNLRNIILKQKKSKTKFHSIVISNQTNYNFLDIFDINWAFDYTCDYNNIYKLKNFEIDFKNHLSN